MSDNGMFSANSRYGDLRDDTARDLLTQLLGSPTANRRRPLTTYAGARAIRHSCIPAVGVWRAALFSTAAGRSVAQRLRPQPARSPGRQPPNAATSRANQSAGIRVSTDWNDAGRHAARQQLTQNINVCGESSSTPPGQSSHLHPSSATPSATSETSALSRGHGIQPCCHRKVNDHTGNISAKFDVISVQSVSFDATNSGAVTVNMAGNANASAGTEFLQAPTLTPAATATLARPLSPSRATSTRTTEALRQDQPWLGRATPALYL
jgi:hypothetical protein